MLHLLWLLGLNSFLFDMKAGKSAFIVRDSWDNKSRPISSEALCNT